MGREAENLTQKQGIFLPQFIEWKFHDFSITQILREINFRDSRIANSAINTFRGSEIDQ